MADIHELLPLNFLAQKNTPEGVCHDLAVCAARVPDQQAVLCGLMHWSLCEPLAITSSRYDMAATRVVVALCDLRWEAGRTVRGEGISHEFTDMLAQTFGQAWLRKDSQTRVPLVDGPFPRSLPFQSIPMERLDGSEKGSLRTSVLEMAALDLAVADRTLREYACIVSYANPPDQNWVRQLEDLAKQGKIPPADASYFNRSVLAARAAFEVLWIRQANGRPPVAVDDISCRIELHQDVLEQTSNILAQGGARSAIMHRPFLPIPCPIDYVRIYLAEKRGLVSWTGVARMLNEPVEYQLAFCPEYPGFNS